MTAIPATKGEALPEAILHLSSLVGSSLLDSTGARLGRVEDVIARLDTGDQLPLVTGLKVRIGGRDLFVPADRIEQLEPQAARTSTTKLNLAQFERRPGEVLLRDDLLGRSVINVRTARLVKAREVELVRRGDVARRRNRSGIRGRAVAPVAAPLPRPYARARRVRAVVRDRAVRRARADLAAAAWLASPGAASPGADRRSRRSRFAREGEEILKAVGHDKELEADVFEELDDQHQVEFLRDRSDLEVAAVLARMASDDAADLLLEIEQDRRIPVLNLLPAPKQLKIKRLLGYNPSTAGGLMNPDFASLPTDATAEGALRLVRESRLPPGQLLVLWVIDPQGRLTGGVFASELVLAERDTAVTSLIETRVPTVSPETELPEVARLMADFNLLAIPVIDTDEKPIGVIAFDDVLELLLPEEWRRRAGDARE